MTLTCYPVFRIFVSQALFEVGISNLICVHVSWDDSVPYHLWVTVTLTSDLVPRIGIESGAYTLYSLR